MISLLFFPNAAPGSLEQSVYLLRSPGPAPPAAALALFPGACA